MAQVTRLWTYGGPGHLYGSFSGKTSVVALILQKGYLKAKFGFKLIYHLKFGFK